MTQEKQMPASQPLVSISLDSRTPRFALYCLLSQAVRSLTAQEKQMPPTVALVFLLGLLHQWCDQPQEPSCFYPKPVIPCAVL